MQVAKAKKKLSTRSKQQQKPLNTLEAAARTAVTHADARTPMAHHLAAHDVHTVRNEIDLDAL